jgi:midasin
MVMLLPWVLERLIPNFGWRAKSLLISQLRLLSRFNHCDQRKMANTSNIYDPLTINLTQQTRFLVDSIPHDSPHLASLRDVSSRPALLQTLSRLLAVPGLTAQVVTKFRPLLLDLCARWLEHDENLEEKFEASALLLEIYPEIFP